MTPETMFRHSLAFERGIALIIGLVILAVLSLIGVAAFSVATQEERMAGNSRDRIRAFEAAEVALRDCEALAATAPFDGTGGTYTAPLSPQASYTEQINWSAPPAGAVHTVSTTTMSNPEWSRQPVCVAEQFQVQSAPANPGVAVPQTSVVHVTALGYGLNSTTTVLLESYYAL